MESVFTSTSKGSGSVIAEADRSVSRPHADVAIRDLAITFDPSNPSPVLVTHLSIVVPLPAFQQLVATAAARAGVNATASLGNDQIGVAVSVSLLRLTVTFSPSISNGQLVLQPRSGVPGWLIGRAAPLVGRTAGLSMSSDGRVTVNPVAFLPPSVGLRSGFTSFQASPNRIELSLG